MQLGELIQTRRNGMGMSLSALSLQMGGSPGASYLSRVESGLTETSMEACEKLADALALPREILLNASGYTTPEQADTALAKLAVIAREPAPIMAALPVMDPKEPDKPADRLPTRSRMLRRREDAFLVDLSDPEDEPYTGEVLASRERKPSDGAPVVAQVRGRVGAWTYHNVKPTGEWLENARGERVAKGFRVLGVILRVVSEINLDGE